MYRISAQTTIRGNAADVWRIVTDVNNWASWDPHEEAARLDGEFAVGAVGWSKPRGGPAPTGPSPRCSTDGAGPASARCPAGN